MNRTRLKLNLGYAYWAFAFSLAFLALTGLIPDWGKWYSDNVHYREQTDALFKGSFAIQNTPAASRNDLAWHDGGVQQVWGLGVPVWRLPFEVLAKVCGQKAFPDRLTFGAAIMVLAFLVFKVMLPQPVGTKSAFRTVIGDPFRLAAVMVLLVFPPVVMMCHYHFDIYEEVVAYAYLYSIGLFVGLIGLARAPTARKYLVISMFTGLAAFIRPTAGVYGLITMALLFYCSRKAKFPWWQSVLGILLFFAGGCLLFLTNQIRFGSGFEFGHSLNFNLFPIWFFDRIYNPFQNEPLPSAARELFGSLFFGPIVGNPGAELRNAFLGQSATPRWRQFYFTTYDLSFVCLLIAAWGSWLWGRLPWRRQSSAQPVETGMAGIWSLIAAGMLAVFYLRCPVISSRYLVDFAPGFAVAIAGLLLSAGNFMEKRGRTGKLFPRLALASVMVWLGLEFGLSKSNAVPMHAVSKTAMLAELPRGFRELRPIPRGYEMGLPLSLYGIPYNGAGWATDGQMQTLVVLFVNDPEYLEIQVAPTTNSQPVTVSNIQAKVGLEFLTVESVTEKGSNSLIRFKAPQRAVYQKGIQVVFLAYVDKDNIGSSRSPLKLINAKWRD